MDGLKHPNAAHLLSRARAVVKEARAPIVSERLKRETGLRAILDQDTRWGSTYQMLDRLVQMKTSIYDLGQCGNEGLKLPLPLWTQLEELRDLLRKSFTLTKQMQLEDLTAGYFFRKWSGLKLILEDNGGQIALDILQSMSKREKELFKNKTVLAAILLDIYNRNNLDTEQKEMASKAVVNICLQLKGLDQEERDSESLSAGESSATEGDGSESDEEINRLRQRKKSGEARSQGVQGFSLSEVETSMELESLDDLAGPDLPSPLGDEPEPEPQPKRRKEASPKVKNIVLRTVRTKLSVWLIW